MNLLISLLVAFTSAYAYQPFCANYARTNSTVNPNSGWYEMAVCRKGNTETIEVAESGSFFVHFECKDLSDCSKCVMTGGQDDGELPAGDEYDDCDQTYFE